MILLPSIAEFLRSITSTVGLVCGFLQLTEGTDASLLNLQNGTYVILP